MCGEALSGHRSPDPHPKPPPSGTLASQISHGSKRAKQLIDMVDRDIRDREHTQALLAELAATPLTTEAQAQDIVQRARAMGVDIMAKEVLLRIFAVSGGSKTTRCGHHRSPTGENCRSPRPLCHTSADVAAPGPPTARGAGGRFDLTCTASDDVGTPTSHIQLC